MLFSIPILSALHLQNDVAVEVRRKPRTADAVDPVINDGIVTAHGMPSTTIAVFLLFFLFSLPPVYAEIIQLKNGNAIETKILKENKEFVIIEAPGGTVKIPKSDIQTIWRGPKEKLMEVRGKDVFFSKGVELYKEGKFREAAASFEQSRGMAGSEAILYANLGSAYASLGDAQKAEENFLAAFKQDPSNVTNLLNLARYYEAVKNFHQAIPCYQKLIVLKPDDADLQRSLAYCEYGAGDYLSAAKLYEVLGRRNDVVAQCNSAAAYIQAGELDRAEAILKPLLESSFPVPRAYLNMATLCRLRKDYGQAEDYYKKGLMHDPKTTEIYLGLARMYLEKNDLDQAEATFNRVLEKEPHNPGALHGLAQVFAEKKDKDKAVAYYEKLLGKDPRDPDLLNGLGLLYLKLNEPQKALKVYQKIFETDDRFAKAHANAGLAYALMNDADNALKEWSRALELDPKLEAAVQNKKLLEDAMRGSKDAQSSAPK